jgi:hypothetical protein
MLGGYPSFDDYWDVIGYAVCVLAVLAICIFAVYAKRYENRPKEKPGKIKTRYRVLH